MALFKNLMRNVLYLIGGVLFLASCDKFEYDPNQTKNRNSPVTLNLSNMAAIQTAGTDTIIRFALISDSHSYYEDFDDVIEQINKEDGIDFVIHAGDITDYGYLKEYEWGISHLEKLNRPFLVVIGNHDLLANGDEVYENLFSEVNFSFIYNDVKFIFYDSNGREYGFTGTVPNLNYLAQEINSGTNFHKVVLVSHVPYMDDDFDPALRSGYLHLLKDSTSGKKILVSLNGHIHSGFDTLYTSKVPHLISGSVGKRVYWIVTIKDGEMTYVKKYAN